jgi:hypothetical protein
MYAHSISLGADFVLTSFTCQLPEEPGFMTLYAKIIVMSYRLGIPPRDLSDFILKRMAPIARKNFMSWDEVEWFYGCDDFNKLPEEKQPEVRKIAAVSIFQSWWDKEGVLGQDSEEAGNELEYLSFLRKDFPDLDADLHAIFEAEKARVEGRWAEKKAARQKNGEGFGATDGAGDNTAGSGWGNDGGNATAGPGWGDPPTQDYCAALGTNDWENDASLMVNDPANPPNSLASPANNYNGNGNGNGYGDGHVQQLSPLHEINMNNFNGITNGGDGDSGEWAEEVNEAQGTGNGFGQQNNGGGGFGQGSW